MTVSIGAVHSAAGAASYFASDNYYTAEQAEGTSQWAGEAAREAGLTGPVDTATFENILNGKLPDGTQVGDPEKRDHGRDFTFSMPKSASLLALVSGDKRILEAHVAAVKETMTWAEKNLAEARIKVDGKDVAVRTGNLIYALFQHDTSRKTDPQSHIHAVIANVTRLPEEFRNPDKVDPKTGEVTRDDGWRAWHNGTMYQASAVLTSMANASLRNRIEALGYSTELVAGGKHGAFEVLGPDGERITQGALDGFSKRSSDIKAKAEELGIKSAEGRREVTKRTRDAKADAGDRTDLVARWREEAKGYGYNGDDIYHAALAEKAARDPDRKGTIERGVIAVRTTIEQATARLSDYLRRPDDPLVDKGLTRLTRTPDVVRTQYATASAIRILGEREAAFETADVLKTALDLGLKGVTHNKVEKRIEQLVEAGHLVREKSERHDRAVDRVTTREAIDQERRILKAMDTGLDEGRSLMSADVAKERLQELAGERPLNSQQLAAAITIVSSQDRIVLVQGRAGAGKSTMLQPVAKAEALHATARLLGGEGTKGIVLTADMRGDAKALAFQNKMVADLKADTGLDAMTVHSFIARNEKFLDGSGSAEALAARKAELQGSYLILDEASMISNRQMDKLTAIANLMEVGRLAIIGDRKQLNPIEAGKAFSVMQASAREKGANVSEVNINMRQRTDDMRLVADLADAGNVRAAIDVMGSRVIESKDRIADAATAWLALSPAERDKTTLLPSGREGRARANEIIQEGLKEEGSLIGEGRNFNVREQANLSGEELRYAQFWRSATILEVTSDRNDLGLARGDYRIDRVYANGKVGLVGFNGQKARVEPIRIRPGDSQKGLKLATEKTIKVHEGERIRWTANDKAEGRGMLNATIAHVEKVTTDGIVVRLNTGEERILPNGDPMLKRMDLAYAINTHMAQGITNETVFSVMGAKETNLSNARAFLVNHTRQQNDVRLFTDDKTKLVAQLERNRGDKSSALEVIGELATEKILKEKDAGADLGMPGERTDPDRPRDHAAADKLDLVLPERTFETAETKADPSSYKPGQDLGLNDKATIETAESKGADKADATPASKPAEREELQLDRSKGLEL